ncbi:MAG: Ig-like domain repeat protein [Gemmataceae bacterium]|nr:Ig-like domain repeat protein [Gemmataceae bacterium]
MDRGAVEFQFPATTTALTVTPTFATAPFRRILTLTATVTPTSTGTNNPPTGTVTFFNGTTSLGTAMLNASGVATLTIPTPTTGAAAGTSPTADAANPLPVGTNTIIARYSGDGSYTPSAASQTQVVRAPTSTIGAYDPTTGTWSLRNSLTGGPADAGSFQFGGPGLLPIVGDWDGDGVFTVAVFDPTIARFMIRNSNTAGAPDFDFRFGPNNVAVPLAGDWDGDGVWGIGTFDPTTATFNLKNTLSAGLPDAGTVIYGLVGSDAVVGDWDGDGDTNIGVVEPDGTWKLKNFNLAGPPDFTFAFGTPNFSNYVVGDWDGNGTYTPGVADPDSGGTLTWSLRNSNSGGPPDAAPPFQFGSAASLPVAGDWNFPAAPLISGSGVGAGAAAIGSDELDGLAAAAIKRLASAGVDSSVLDGLASARVQLSALAGPYLGFAYGDYRQVLIDPDAAGHGWFVDPTPFDDEEFDDAGNALAGSGAEGRMDLLTAVLHEFGHLAGLGDDSGSALMAPLLGTGTRRTQALDAVFGGQGSGK